MNSRIQIEQFKRDFQAKLEENSDRHRREIISGLDNLTRNMDGANYTNFGNYSEIL